MTTGTEALDAWQETFNTKDGAPLRAVMSPDLVVIDTYGDRETLDEAMAWATTMDFSIGDYVIHHEDETCCCGTHSVTLDGVDYGSVCFFARKTEAGIDMWKIHRAPPQDS